MTEQLNGATIVTLSVYCTDLNVFFLQPDRYYFRCWCDYFSLIAFHSFISCLLWKGL